MTNEGFDRLTDGQRDCLRLVLQHFSIKEIGRELGIAPSTVNQRLERARSALGVDTSPEAARLVARREGWSGIWTHDPRSVSPLPAEPETGLSEVATEEIGRDDADDMEARAGRLNDPADPPYRSFIKWPFPTSGRRHNDLTATGRLAWVLPVAILSVSLLIILALLSLGLQDMLAGLQGALKRL
jgi:DNA-binding CsgD family transcriptional regulator